jgi:hypothetical protein
LVLRSKLNLAQAASARLMMVQRRDLIFEAVEPCAQPLELIH